MGEYIDDFEKMEAEIEQKSKNSCYNCKHSAVAANKEPYRKKHGETNH